MKQIIYILIGLLVYGNISAQNANDILDKAASAYTGSNGITAGFAMRTHSEPQNYTESFEGVINIKGDKFTLSTPDMQTWYDGTTQWTYVEQKGEVDISTPDGDELLLVNPALLLKSYKKGFAATYKGESTATNGKSAYDIELTPKKKSDIINITLQIEKFSGLPASISVKMKNGINNNIYISDLKKEVNQPDSFFSFNEAAYPDVYINDLR